MIAEPPSQPFNITADNADSTRTLITELGLASLLIVFGPLLFYAVWRCFRTWGWWRVTGPGRVDEERGSRPYQKKRYVRTWHGWVERADGRQAMPSDQRAEMRARLLSTASRANYNRIFWQPSPSSEPLHDSLDQVKKRHWWQSWNLKRRIWRKVLPGERPENPVSSPRTPVRSTNSTHNGCNLDETLCRAEGSEPLMSGAIGMIGEDTIRHFVDANAHDKPWTGKSESTRRAIAVQLFLSRNSMQYEPIQAFAPSPADNEQTASKGPPQNPRGLLPRVASTISLPTSPISSFENKAPRQSATVPVAGRRPAHRGRRWPLDAAFRSPHVSSSSENYWTPREINSNTSRLGKVVVESTAVGLGHGERGARCYTYEAGFANSLGRRLDIWASPMLLDPFSASVGETNGTAGRRNSPAMGWTTIEDTPEQLRENLQRAQASYALALPDQQSTPERQHSLRQKVKQMEAMRNAHPQSGYMFKSDAKEEKAGKCGGGRWYHAHRLATSRQSPAKPATELGRGLLELTMTPTRQRPDRTLYPSLPTAEDAIRSVEIVSDKIKRSQPTAEHVPKQLSTSEKAFLTHLDRKLNWLQHELTPGFRGPDDNPAEHFSLTKNAVSRATEMDKRLGDSRARREGNRLPGVKAQRRKKIKIDTFDIECWRSAVNESRTDGDEGPGALLRPIEQFKDMGNQGAADGAIDTAAWVLKRPPQGFPSLSVQAASGLLNRKGGIEKHHDWEKRRRPEIVKRMSTHRTLDDGQEPDGRMRVSRPMAGALLGRE